MLKTQSMLKNNKGIAPELSIVIASINGQPYLAECLAALRQQTGNVTAEVIVADCVGSSVTDFVTAKYPEVRLLPFSEPQSVPILRAAGILAAQGEIIAITEDHCIPPPNWYESVVLAHANYPGSAIGGSVDNGATKRILDWAVFFCEYSNFISPVPQGVVHDLPGPNVSYKRSGLIALADLIKHGYWETFVHSYLESQGQQLWSDPSIPMNHKKHFTLVDFLTERYHYSRAFAGKRNQSISRSHRLFYFLLSPLLPPLLLVRISRRILSKKRHLGVFVLSLPYLLLFMSVWAIGECVGYAIGPGESELYLS